MDSRASGHCHEALRARNPAGPRCGVFAGQQPGGYDQGKGVAAGDLGRRPVWRLAVRQALNDLRVLAGAAIADAAEATREVADDA